MKFMEKGFRGECFLRNETNKIDLKMHADFMVIQRVREILRRLNLNSSICSVEKSFNCLNQRQNTKNSFQIFLRKIKICSSDSNESGVKMNKFEV